MFEAWTLNGRGCFQQTVATVVRGGGQTVNTACVAVVHTLQAEFAVNAVLNVFTQMFLIKPVLSPDPTTVPLLDLTNNQCKNKTHIEPLQIIVIVLMLPLLHLIKVVITV